MFAEINLQLIGNGKYIVFSAAPKPQTMTVELEEYCVHDVYGLDLIGKSLPNSDPGRYDLESLVYSRRGLIQGTHRAVFYNGNIVTVHTNRSEYQAWVDATLTQLRAVGYNPAYLRPLILDNGRTIFIV